MAYDNTDGRLRGRKLQAARLRIWSADPHCARCRKLVAYPHGFELDHIKALHKDGSTNDDDNLQVLCHPCHAEKTAISSCFAPVWAAVTTSRRGKKRSSGQGSEGRGGCKC